MSIRVGVPLSAAAIVALILASSAPAGALPSVPTVPVTVPPIVNELPIIGQAPGGVAPGLPHLTVPTTIPAPEPTGLGPNLLVPAPANDPAASTPNASPDANTATVTPPTSAATSTRADDSRAVPVDLSGSVEHPHESAWSTITRTTRRLAPLLGLLALAVLLRVVMGAWIRDARNKRAANA